MVADSLIHLTTFIKPVDCFRLGWEGGFFNFFKHKLKTDKETSAAIK